MDSITVLIAAPGSGAIGPAVLGRLNDLGIGRPRWLAPAEACEVEGAVGPVAEALNGLAIDVNAVPLANRRKRLLIADMDSTMIEQECIDELGEVAGLGPRIKDITAQAMRGELDFAGALRARVGLLAGLDASFIERIIAERLTYARGGATLVATMKAAGAWTALVSGGFRPFTMAVAAQLGFDENAANDLLVRDGKLTGEVAEPILGQDAKVQALNRISRAHGFTPAEAIAVGDGANDLPMLLAAGMGIALHAKPHVQAQSRIRINHGDLTALLFLQGYEVSEFVAA